MQGLSRSGAFQSEVQRRQGQVDGLAGRAAVSDLQRGGRYQVVGNVEDTAIRHDSACLGDGDLAEAQYSLFNSNSLKPYRASFRLCMR